ncbi:hypothetical protein LTR66_007599 [Elasticomyces elasticus]|nr:hypothetical protein LTR66_007599 [Elasticomyces elasticus]
MAAPVSAPIAAVSAAVTSTRTAASVGTTTAATAITTLTATLAAGTVVCGGAALRFGKMTFNNFLHVLKSERVINGAIDSQLHGAAYHVALCYMMSNGIEAPLDEEQALNTLLADLNARRPGISKRRYEAASLINLIEAMYVSFKEVQSTIKESVELPGDPFDFIPQSRMA